MDVDIANFYAVNYAGILLPPLSWTEEHEFFSCSSVLSAINMEYC